MRSQYMPLALCLFLSVFVMSQSVLAKSNTTKKPEKSMHTNDHDDTNQFAAFSFNLMNFQTPVSESNVMGLKKESSFSSSQNNVSVISYKFNNQISGNLESSTQNFAVNSPTFETNSFWLGIFYGAFIMLLALNLVCFFLFGEKAFLYFFGACSAITVLLLGSDGTFAAISSLVSESIPFISATALLLVAFFNHLYGSYYLKLDKTFPKLKLISYTLLAVSVSIIIGAAIAFEVKLLPIASVASLAVISLYLIMGVIYFSKNNYAKFYVIATAIPTLFMIDFFVLRDLGLTFLATEAIHIKTAILIQTLIMTYAIIYRMRAIKEENELRLTEMRIFMKRKELMNRENVKQMVEEVYLENLIMQYDLDGLEIKLLQYISEGKENTKIARKLKMSEKEVEEFTNELYMKLEIREQIKEDHRMLESQPDYIYN